MRCGLLSKLFDHLSFQYLNLAGTKLACNYFKKLSFSYFEMTVIRLFKCNKCDFFRFVWFTVSLWVVAMQNVVVAFSNNRKRMDDDIRNHCSYDASAVQVRDNCAAGALKPVNQPTTP